MHYDHPTLLTAADHARLQGLMCTMIGSRTPLASLVRRKLGSAVLLEPEDIGADLVTSGRLVRFTIDGEETEERVLTWKPPKRGDTSSMSLLVPRGLALFGLSAGQFIAYPTQGGRTEHIEIKDVLSEIEPAKPLPAREEVAVHLVGSADANSPMALR